MKYTLKTYLKRKWIIRIADIAGRWICRHQITGEIQLKTKDSGLVTEDTFGMIYLVEWILKQKEKGRRKERRCYFGKSK